MSQHTVSITRPKTLQAGQPVYLGIDVGGTNVKLGLVSDDGQLLTQSTAPTPALGTPDRVFEHAMEFAAEQLNLLGCGVTLNGVGLAVPGVLDTSAMALREVVNLPGWLDQPLLRLLANAAQVPAMVVNDANAAALAEHSRRGLGNHSLALMTLGTGIGCGVVVGGHPHSGDHGCAGELGHIAVRFGEDALPCTCGSRGHLESYAGSGGVIARLRAAYASQPQLAVPECLSSQNVTPREIAEQAAAGNAVCQAVIDETASYVGAGIGMLAQVVDPAVVLLGGAMTFGGPGTPTGTRFMKLIRQTVRDTTLAQVGKHLIVDFASLGNDAGILGAALVAKQAAADASIQIANHSDRL
tara:strand:- start:620 stop:1684 length:1065 start_codon:yes stop_codon:yes gene_type:complete